MLTSGSSASSGSDKGNDGVDNHDPAQGGVWRAGGRKRCWG
jgi:hypothetical protein